MVFRFAIRNSFAVVKYVVALFLLLAGGVAGWFMRPACPEIVAVRTDTLVRIDTLRDTVLVVKESFTTRIDRDTLRVSGDTVFVAVEIPIERRIYETPDYRAEIEGYKPSLVSMDVYHRTEYITRTETLKMPSMRTWRVGLSAGFRTTFLNGNTNLSPYATLTANRIRGVPIGFSAGYVANIRGGDVTMIPFVGLNVNYPLFGFGKKK